MKMTDFTTMRFLFTPVLIAVIAIGLTACSTPKLVESLKEKGPEAVHQDGRPDQDGQPYYVINGGLPVRAAASASAKVLGHLFQHEKVIRTRLEKGYAYIATADGRLAGWVDNNRLDWRKPAGKKPAKATTDEVVDIPDQGESVQPAPSTDSPEPSGQIPAEPMPQEAPAPEPEPAPVVTGGNGEPVASAPPTPEVPASVTPEPVATPAQESDTPPPAAGADTRPASSIFDSF
jgi:hypothetical protein